MYIKSGKQKQGRQKGKNEKITKNIIGTEGQEQKENKCVFSGRATKRGGWGLLSKKHFFFIKGKIGRKKYEPGAGVSDLSGYTTKKTLILLCVFPYFDR